VDQGLKSTRFGVTKLANFDHSWRGICPKTTFKTRFWATPKWAQNQAKIGDILDMEYYLIAQELE